MYIAPDSSYSATFPGVRRRLGAGAIDWLLAWVVFLIASIVGGVFQAVGVTSWEDGDLRGIPGAVLIVFSQLLVAAPVVAYFAYYWTRGSTLGMRALDIELVREETGKPPGWKRALPRACLAFVVSLAVYNVMLAWTGRAVEEYSSAERALIAASAVAAGLCLAAKMWMVVDERRRSLLDRAFGLLYVEELVFTRAARSPWTEAGR